MSAEKDAVGEVGAASIGIPLVDMVRLALRRWAVTAGEFASPVADRQGDALLGREQPLFPPDVEGRSATVGEDDPGSRVTFLLADEAGRYRGSRFFEEPGAIGLIVGVSAVELFLGDDDPDAGLTRAEDRGRVGLGSCAEGVHQKIEDELVVRSGVIELFLGSLGFFRIHEPWSAPARAHG